MIIKFVKDSWLVLLAALVFGLGVSGIHGQLKPRIERNAREKIARELRQLFGRPVDLVEPGGLRNPYFIKRVNQTRRMIYGAS